MLASRGESRDMAVAWLLQQEHEPRHQSKPLNTGSGVRIQLNCLWASILREPSLESAIWITMLVAQMR